MISRLNRRAVLRAFLAATTALCVVLTVPQPASALLWAQETTQLANNVKLMAQLVQQVAMVKNQLQMLASFDLNDAANMFAVTQQAQSLLGQLDGVLYDVGGVAGMIEERYPHEYPGGTTLDQLIEHVKGWHDTQRNAFTESHQLQSQLREAALISAERDRASLDASMAAPGIRSAIQAGNQLTASVATELRNLQFASLTHARAVETQRLEETGKQAQRRAFYCEHFKDNVTPFPGCPR